MILTFATLNYQIRNMLWLKLLHILRPLIKSSSMDLPLVTHKAESSNSLNSLQQHEKFHNLVIQGITADSRQVKKDFIFVAIAGTKHDGHQHIMSACQQGAAVIVVEKSEYATPSYVNELAAQSSSMHSVLVLQVTSSREALDLLAAEFYQQPSQQMLMLGVTGTNGKTSITYLLEWVLNRISFPCGVLGTVDHHFLENVWQTENTTPGPVELHSRLKEIKDLGAKAIAMEVSSHALEQSRADGVHFDVVIFTNLTRDHLDYHSDMKTYFQAKQRLFSDLIWKTKKHKPFAIINTDDTWGARLRVSSKAGLWSYGMGATADFRFEILDVGFSYTSIQLFSPFGVFKSVIPMCGTHNVYNVVAVIAALASRGIYPELSLHALRSFPGVPGRLQSVPNEKDRHVFVDYAHSPDALENVLKSLQRVRAEMQKNNSGNKRSAKIITIFGCGGDRDKGKRPLMAMMAEKYSDYVVVTSDNPRSEDPGAIISDILDGFSVEFRKKVIVEVDRAKGIQHGIDISEAGDVILIAGKGHEDYQIIGTEKRPFSDWSCAKELLR